jgi:hypothetical protein
LGDLTIGRLGDWAIGRLGDLTIPFLMGDFGADSEFSRLLKCLIGSAFQIQLNIFLFLTGYFFQKSGLTNKTL